MLTNYTRIGEAARWETLPNGLPVCIVPKKDFQRKYALFATRYGGMDMRFQLNGQWLDTPAGIAHYLEHKMFDTAEGNALQELAKNGAEPNAFTSNAITCYYFDATDKFYESLEILLSFVSVPYFTEESVEKEQGIIAQEINMIEDNPEWQVYKRLMQALYHTSPARTSVAGSVESIRQITAQTLYDCHKAFYTPANMCLVVVGDVDSDEVLRLAEEVLAARYHRLVRSCARPYFLAGGDSEDLLQEGMIGLIKAMREFRPDREAGFQTFAEVCIRRRLYTVLKSASSGKHQPLNQAIPLNPSFFDVSLAFAQVDPEVLLIDREKTAGLLEYTCKQLSAFEAEILGYYLDGLTCREIAETVGKPPKSVENAVQRIRRKIGRQLQSGDISKG